MATAAWKCKWCGLHGIMNPISNVMVLNMGANYSKVRQGIFSCSGCNGLSIGVFSDDSAAPGWRTVGTNYWVDKTVFDWEPKWIEGQDVPDVPEHIGRAASEAHKSQSIGNQMSAILMARTVIEATAKEKGITAGNLFQKIDALESKDFVRSDTKEAAHEIRQFGNDMAHGDIAVPVDKSDAAEILAIMDEILNEVFQGPARTARVRQLRQARSNPTP